MIRTRTYSSSDGDPVLEFESDTGSTIRVVEHEGERHAWLRKLGGAPHEIPADPASIRNHVTGL
jgi:hypothetical protein